MRQPGEADTLPAPGSGDSQHSRITRRSALAGAGLLGLGAGLDRVVGGPKPRPGASSLDGQEVPFHGRRQAGIATPPQAHLAFASFDLRAPSRQSLRALLTRWTAASSSLAAGESYEPSAQTRLQAPSDTGEALGLGPARLTITFGFGPTLFEWRGRDRFGLAARRPALLKPLPSFPGEQLDPARSGGDLCVQACAEDPQVAFHAIHVLARVGAPDTALRWLQLGFRPPAGLHPQTPRNLLGFKDGTENIRPDDTPAMNRFVWVGADEHPGWMRDGSYLVARRIELTLSTWDRLTLAQQEGTIGRHKRDGAPLGGRREHDPVGLGATDAHGRPLIPTDAHIRLASPELNGGQRLLRRGYSYSAGATSDSQGAAGPGVDGGLFFIAFVRDPARQFIPIQRRLAAGDALSAFTVHTGSAIFACPPGAVRGGFVGQSLLDN